MREDWQTVKLGDLAKVSYGYTAKASTEPIGPKFLRITDIQNGNVNWDTVPHCPITEIEQNKHSLKSNDIVFARTGATTGKSFLLHEPPESVAASYLIRLRLESSELLPDFIYLFFQTTEYWEKIKKGTTGSAQGGFNASKLSNLNLPLPPLPEQERIVSILDKAFEGIDKAIAQTEQNLASARELFESYLNNIFTQKGEDWVEKKLGDICEIKSGAAFPKKYQGLTEEEYPFYKVSDMNLEGNEVRMTSTSNTISNSTRKALRANVFTKGCIIFPKVGGAILTNKKRLITTPCCVDNNVMGLFPNLDVVDEHFLFFFMLGVSLYDWSNKGNPPSIRKTTVEASVICLSPLKVQKDAVAKLEKLKALVLRLETLYTKKLESLKELKQSLLQQAFAGELTKEDAA